MRFINQIICLKLVGSDSPAVLTQGSVPFDEPSLQENFGKPLFCDGFFSEEVHSLASTSLTEQLLLVGGVHHEEWRKAFSHCQLINLVHNFQTIQVWHVKVQDAQRDGAVLTIARLFEILLDQIDDLLAVSHVGDDVGVKKEHSLEKCFHCDYDEVHVVGNDDLSSQVLNRPVIADLIRRTIVCLDIFNNFMHVSWLYSCFLNL